MNVAAGRGWAVLAAIGLICSATPANAQATLPKDATWSLEGAQGGYCIWYLADPVLARTPVPSSTSLLPAGTGADVPGAGPGYIRDEPKFAQWIPGTICVGFYQRVSTAAPERSPKPSPAVR